MTTIETIIARIGAAFADLQAAAVAAQAVESGRTPLDADLRRLGIDPQAFSTIGHG